MVDLTRHIRRQSSLMFFTKDFQRQEIRKERCLIQEEVFSLTHLSTCSSQKRCLRKVVLQRAVSRFLLDLEGTATISARHFSSNRTHPRREQPKRNSDQPQNLIEWNLLLSTRNSSDAAEQKYSMTKQHSTTPNSGARHIRS